MKTVFKSGLMCLLLVAGDASARGAAQQIYPLQPVEVTVGSMRWELRGPPQPYEYSTGERWRYCFERGGGADALARCHPRMWEFHGRPSYLWQPPEQPKTIRRGGSGSIDLQPQWQGRERALVA